MLKTPVAAGITKKKKTLALIITTIVFFFYITFQWTAQSKLFDYILFSNDFELEFGDQQANKTEDLKLELEIQRNETEEHKLELDKLRNERTELKVEDLLPLYRQVYSTYTITKFVLLDPVEEKKNPDREASNSSIRSLDTYGESVLTNGCEITVVLMDPRIPLLQKGAPDFFALESVAAYLPNACVVIQTSKCKFADTSSDQIVYQQIYDLALPLFQDMMKRGQVRITFVNHLKYNLKSCSDFFNPSAAFMNVHYWGDDEFIPGVDSDTVLMIQNDAVLCHTFDVSRYSKYAFVGAVWGQYQCDLLRNHWKSFVKPQQKWKMRSQRGEVIKALEFEVVESFPEICANGIPPIGNGGFSLRSRKAMIKAIETCPHTTWSGIDLKDRELPCLVHVTNTANIHAMQEDLYFGAVLRATGAILPTAFEASLFSVEMNWPGQAFDQFGGTKDETDLARIANETSAAYHGAGTVKWGNGKARADTVPIGFHQPYYYHAKEALLTGDVVKQCPFVQYIYDPLDKRNLH